MKSFKEFLSERRYGMKEVLEIINDIKNSNPNIYFDFDPTSLTFKITTDKTYWPLEISFDKNDFDKVCRSLLIRFNKSPLDKKRILNQKSDFITPLYKELETYAFDTSISKSAAKVILNKHKNAFYNI